MKHEVIIVAGGKGVRMGSTIPKQFLCLCGKPLLMRTIEAFVRFDKDISPIVVLPAQQMDYWNDLCKEYHFTLPHLLAVGGETRFHSVKSGLEKVSSSSIVAIHDGVRPFVSHRLLSCCFLTAEARGTALPVLKVKETLRKITSPHSSQTEDRELYRLVQTPQTFRSDLLKRAYAQNFQPTFTDDASVVEALGVEITLIEGDEENVKITTPKDLQWAESYFPSLR